MEMNSSPVSPGYWPSQWRPPANPYTENRGRRERNGVGKGKRERERERGKKRQPLLVKSGHRWRGRPDVLQRRGRELGEGPEWKERYGWCWCRCFRLEFWPWSWSQSWSSHGVSEPPSELALKQRLSYTGSDRGNIVVWKEMDKRDTADLDHRRLLLWVILEGEDGICLESCWWQEFHWVIWKMQHMFCFLEYKFRLFFDWLVNICNAKKKMCPCFLGSHSICGPYAQSATTVSYHKWLLSTSRYKEHTWLKVQSHHMNHS